MKYLFKKEEDSYDRLNTARKGGKKTYLLMGLSVVVLVACIALYKIDKTSKIDEIEEAQKPIELAIEFELQSLMDKYEAMAQELEIS